jgi:hypothetical protein
MAFNVEIGAKIIDRSTSAPNVIKIRAFGALGLNPTTLSPAAK